MTVQYYLHQIFKEKKKKNYWLWEEQLQNAVLRHRGSVRMLELHLNAWPQCNQRPWMQPWPHQHLQLILSSHHCVVWKIISNSYGKVRCQYHLLHSSLSLFHSHFLSCFAAGNHCHFLSCLAAGKQSYTLRKVSVEHLLFSISL